MPSKLTPEFLRTLERLRFLFGKSKPVTGDGAAASSRGGGMVEFSEYQAYSPGDDFRAIDWHVYSRLGQFVIKKFAKEETGLMHVTLDASRSMSYDPEKWKLALETAAAAGYAALSAGLRLRTWSLHGKEAREGVSVASLARVQGLFEWLERIAPGGPTQLDQGLGMLGPRLHAGSALAVISDWLDESPVKRVLQLLRARRLELFAMHVLAVSEWHPPACGPALLKDAETGEPVAVTMDGAVVRRYAEALSAWHEGWRTFCGGHDIVFHAVLPRETAVDSLIRLWRGGRVAV